jgi:hypothetical protein
VALERAGLPYRLAPLATVREVLATPEAKADCWRRHDAAAADLESAEVLEWAARAGLPALAVRAVADGPREALPLPLALAVAEGGRIRVPVVLGWGARPALAGPAWRLWRRSRLALGQLARFLTAFATTVGPGP